MSRLSQIISEKEREVASLERESAEVARRLNVAQIELCTLRFALSVVLESPPEAFGMAAAPNGQDDPRPPSGNGPKKLWSLSEPYRRLVGAIIAEGNPAMNSYRIAALAKTVGLNLAPKQASGRFRKYVVSGMAERIGDQYRLTAPAVRAFEQGAAAAA
jgi:hypothetical protein